MPLSIHLDVIPAGVDQRAYVARCLGCPAAALDALCPDFGAMAERDRRLSHPVDAGTLTSEGRRITWTKADELPSLADQAAGLAGVLSSATAAALAGKPILAADGLQRARLALCEACPRKQGPRCAACGCFVRVKVRVASAACPLARW